MKTEREILELLVTRVAEALEVEPEAVDVDADLASLGLDSIRAFHLAGDLAEWLDRDLSPTLLWDHASLRSVAEALASEGPSALSG